MKAASEARKAYFAGVLDVVGMMAIRTHRRRPQPIIEVRQTDRRLLDELADAFGGTVGVYRQRKVESWYWRRTFESAREVTQIIRPHLRLRTAIADEILRWEAVPRSLRHMGRVKAQEALYLETKRKMRAAGVRL